MNRVLLKLRSTYLVKEVLLSVARIDSGLDGCCDWRGMELVIVDGCIGFERLSGPLESPLLGKFDFRFGSPESKYEIKCTEILGSSESDFRLKKPTTRHMTEENYSTNVAKKFQKP